LAAKFGVTVLNSPGTVDSDYRGEVKVIIINHGPEAFVINRGDRIAQMVIAPVTQGIPQETEELSDTERGEGGFGSTGGTSNHSKG
jgi:dUTP pyrophosphatase